LNAAVYDSLITTNTFSTTYTGPNLLDSCSGLSGMNKIGESG